MNWISKITTTIHTLSELKDLLESYYEKFEKDEWIFRGQDDSLRKLLPSIFRGPKVLKNEQLGFYRYSDDVNEEVKNELRIVVDFFKTIHRSGLRIPGDVQIILNKYLVDSIPSFQEHSVFPTYELYEFFGLAQHHGIPTRFMDFTYNPFIALFFATTKNGLPLFQSETDQKKSSIWLVNKDKVEEFGEKKFRVITAESVLNQYLFRQEACFLFDVFSNIEWSKSCSIYKTPVDISEVEKTNLSLHNGIHACVRNEAEINDYIRKIDIPYDLNDEIWFYLDKRNINLAHLMPSYDNVSRYISKKSELMNRLKMNKRLDDILSESMVKKNK